MEFQDSNLTTLLLKKEKELQNLSKLRVGQLQEQLASKDQTIYDLESQIRRLYDDFNYNLNLIKQRDEEIAELEATVSDFSLRNMSKSGANAYWSQDENLNSDIQRDLFIKNEELKNAIDKIRILENKLESNQESLEIQLQEAKSMLSRLRFELDSEKEKNYELEETISEFKAKYENERSGFQYAGMTVQKLEEALSDLDAKYDKERHDFFVKEACYKDTEDKLLKLKQDHEKEISELKRRINVVNSDRDSELQLIKHRYEIEIAQINANKQIIFDQITNEHQEKVNKLQEYAKGLLDENTRNSQAIGLLNMKLLENEKCFNKEICELRNELSYKLDQIEQLKNNLSIKNSELEALKVYSDNYKAQITQKTDELARLNKSILKLQNKAEDQDKEITAYKEFHIKEMRNLTEEMQERINLQQELKFDHEKKENKLEKEIKMLSQKIEMSEKHKNPHEYQEIILELERARDEIFTKDRELARVSKLLETIRHEKDKISHEKEQFRDANVRLLCDNNKGKDEVYNKLENIENNIGMLYSDMSKKTPTLSNWNNRSRSVIPDNLKGNNDKRVSRILQVKSKLDKRFSKFENP